MRGAGVEPHPHPDRPFAERVASLERCGQCGRRGGEGDEEGVALGVDLDAPVASERIAQGAAMSGQRIGIGFGAEGVEQPGRALDIGEEEGDRPRR